MNAIRSVTTHLSGAAGALSGQGDHMDATLLEAAARNALALLEELYPTLDPNETTSDMAIWVTCEQLRAALDTDTVIETVADTYRCPECGENRLDWLTWIEGDTVRCQACETVYKVGGTP
jgi:hypothetical protein